MMLREAEVRISMDGRGRWITYSSTQCPHSGLAGSTSVEAYRQIGQSDHGGHAPHDLMIKQAA
jgi:putative transposase